MYGGIQRGVLPCREETHLGEHADAAPLQQHMDLREHLHPISNCMRYERWRLVDQQLEELLLVVPDDWGLVMATGKQLSGVQVDVFLVKSLGLTEACGIFQSYGQLRMAMLPLFHYMVTQVELESHTLHQWWIWSGSVGICPRERGRL
jgi:hypothetical protein